MFSSHSLIRGKVLSHLISPIFSVHANNSFSCQTVKSIRLLNAFNCHQNVKWFSAAPSKVRLFSEKHEWVEVSGDVGIVGISQYAQESLGDIVYAQLPNAGSDITKNDEVGALESVKAASELYSPVSGKVLEKNNDVESSPSLVNQSCYEKGWLFKVNLKDLDELKDLMNEDQYSEFLKSDKVH